MSRLLDTILLFALPASGKSEIRRYIGGLSPERCREELHLGPTLQLDDYPYVHLMHRIDDELHRRRRAYVFYAGPTRPFRDPYEWGTLIELLNEDFDDLVRGRVVEPASAAQHLFDRLDAARSRVGLPRALDDLPFGLRRDVAQALEAECAEELTAKNRTIARDRAGTTIVIEAARGGPIGAVFPLVPPRGYDYALSRLSPAILERASILHVVVTPEESRRKNVERGRPDAQGSILFHSVPLEVMLGEYGCDDLDWLVRQSDRPGTVRVERVVEDVGPGAGARASLRTFHLPIGRFDNRADLTSFVREPKETWKPADAAALHAGLTSALSTLAAASR